MCFHPTVFLFERALWEINSIFTTCEERRGLEIVAVKSSINSPGFQGGDRISSVRRRVSDKCDLRRVKKNTNTISTACTFFPSSMQGIHQL